MQPPIMWDAVCGNSSAFWDYQRTWNTSYPDFTDCFHRTVLLWVPCSVLWIFLPFEICCLKYSRARRIPWNIFNITKLISTILLFILTIIKLIFLILEYTKVESLFIEISTTAGVAATFLLSCVLIYYERKQGIQSSGLFFFFWLTCSITGGFTFSNALINFSTATREEQLSYTLFIVYYPLVVSQLLLSVFKDAEPLYRCKEDAEENACPKNSSSFISKMSFSWLTNLLWRCYRSHMQVNDIWKSTPEVTTKSSVPQLLKALTNTDTSTGPKLHWAIWKIHWPLFIKAWTLRIVGDTLIYANPVLLQYLLAFLSSDEPFWHGYVIIIAMFFAALAESLTCWHASFDAHVLIINMQSSITSMIYRKSLTICNSCKRATTTGEIINHMAVDVSNIVNFLYELVFNVSFILQIGIGIYLLYNLLGVAAFAGLGVMILLKIQSGFLAYQWEKIEIKQLKCKDERIKHINEAIIGIKVLKFFAWEKPFMQRIGDIRLREIKNIRRGLIYGGVTTMLWTVSPFVIATVMIATYVLIDENNVLDATKAFVAVSLVDILSIPMMQIPPMITHFVQASVSMGRVNEFLGRKDLSSSNVSHDNNKENAIDIEDGSFSWDAESDPILEHINLKVPEGQLIAVVGQVGCGKSSLLSAVLGEMEKLDGEVFTKGRIAYVPQQAWIQNATLKNNILFGKPFDHNLYDKVVKASALEPDLSILPGGDETEIGEKGINLSGGQKQRVSLARAAYCDADIYLLDDPLSAVDTHVGKHIFQHIIGPKGLLKNKTRILVTHNTTYLPSVDVIVVINNKRISEIGTYTELVNKDGAFAEFLSNYFKESTCSDHYLRSDSILSKHDDENDDNEEGLEKYTCTLTTTEHMERGEVKKSIYFLYLKYIGVGFGVAFVALLAISEVFNAAAHVWLSIWTSDSSSADEGTSDSKLNMRLIVYSTLGLCYGIFLFFGLLTSVFASVRVSVGLHYKLLYSVIRCPMSFFDTTPSGRIVNRFSRDMDMIDNDLPSSFQDFAVCVIDVLGAFIVISIYLPLLLVIIIPVAGVYYGLQKFMVRSADQLRRLESVTKSPLYSRFSETIAGTSTVRAFRRQNQFIREFEDLIDTNLKHSFYLKVLFRWIGLRLDLLGNVLVCFTALFGILHKDSLSVSTIALIVTYASSINFIFAWMVHTAGLLESNIVAIERLHEYICLNPEAEWEQPNVNLDSNWPTLGTIEFKNYSTKYREELSPVLSDLNCEITDGEKIGVVGRTGAGKSSITLSLFRILEAIEGAVIIDGVNIAKIGLHDLRSRLTIIPQDPVLYSGSLRMNLDPFNQHADEDLWKALELSHLKAHVTSLPDGLMHNIAEGGENLSVGQRQLVCLARALLRKGKILILDEATAAIDLETDDLIQTTIRQEFETSTVITIAHRLNTIMDSTRIMVMDNGVIKEFDTPQALLRDEKSIFYSMAEAAGLV